MSSITSTKRVVSAYVQVLWQVKSIWTRHKHMLQLYCHY